MSASKVQGYLALLLHAHLPYVKGNDVEATLEERWFYEAVSDCYLPLIDMLDRLLEDRINFRLAISLSPTLLAMMEDPLMKRRTRQYLITLQELAEKEVLRLWGEAIYIETARHYAERLKRQAALYDRLQGDLIAKLRSLYHEGCLELIPCAATHAFLPLVKNDGALRAQLEAAVTEFRRHFGRTPTGIWLPECGYTPAVEPHLQALGLRYFVVDAHAVGHATKAKAGTAAPLRTPSGAAAFARDAEASAQVWSAKAGYPSDPDYREYYRDIGYDLGRGCEAEWQYIKPYMLPDGKRIHTGLKYYRVTGHTDAKEPYHPGRAAQKAQQHAEHFLAAQVEQLRLLCAEGEAPPILVCPFDAELFGHWWYEGPIWLEAVLRGLEQAIAGANCIVRNITLADYIRLYPPRTEADLSQSSWGRGGYAEVWLQPKTDWIYPRLHEAEDRMIRLAGMYPVPESLPVSLLSLLNLAAEELMLAQSSDWPFMIDSGTFPTYAEQRILNHLNKFHSLLDLVETGAIQPCEVNHQLDEPGRRDPIFPTMSYTFYLPADKARGGSVPDRLSGVPAPPPKNAAAMHGGNKDPRNELRILMLTWEYPPRVIGGLSRAVFDLSRHLSVLGHEVHVITCRTEETPAYELLDGVHIHRVAVLQSLTAVQFLDWVFQMNLAFMDYILDLAKRGYHYHMIHAHDWLVYYCASQCREALKLPLAVTIHATESGRNFGIIQTEFHQTIHDLEQKLMNEADCIITCSLYMKQEVQLLFGQPENKVITIPNGVDTMVQQPGSMGNGCKGLHRALRIHPEHRVLCFLGRLVREKGVQIVIEAMQIVWEHYPATKLIIAGTGPMAEQLINQAEESNERILFTGFLDRDDTTILLHAAELCIIPSLYEPFGIVALEAMSAGTPVIASDVGGLSEIIEHDIDGFKVPPGCPAALGKQIVEAMGHPVKCMQLAQAAAAKTRQKYNWSLISAITVEAYNSIQRIEQTFKSYD